MKKKLNVWFYIKWIGGGFIFAGAIGQIIYNNFTTNILSLYFLGCCLFLAGLIREKSELRQVKRS
jgi:hypothetical protein